MDPVTVSTTISRPRQQVFEYLADIANHAEFNDHYLVDWHLTREASYGTGAGARFRVKAPLSRFNWADMTFAEMQPPHRIVEHGRAGKYNRIRMLGTYTLSPGPDDTTKVRVHARDASGDALRQADGGARRPGLDQAPDVPRDAAAAADPRGGPRPRAPCDDRRALTASYYTAAVRRLLTAASLLASASLAAACGTHHSSVADANNNGAYVKAGPLTYQLQVSRLLNQYSPEDSGYLVGLPTAQSSLASNQEWFGVFLWAKNQTSQPHQTTDNFDIVDTQGNVYHPIVASNPYTWTSQMLEPGATQPTPNTTASFGPTQGALVLFKLYSSGNKSVYSNRPLTLQIRGSSNKVWATISLDL